MPAITWSCERQGGSHSLHSSAPLPNEYKKIKILSHYSALGLYLASSFNLAAVLSCAATTPKTKQNKKRMATLSHFRRPNIISTVITTAEGRFFNVHCCRDYYRMFTLFQQVMNVFGANSKGVYSLYTTHLQNEGK